MLRSVSRGAVVVVWLAGCSSAPRVDSARSAALTDSLTGLVDRAFAAAPRTPGMTLRVESPTLGLSFSRSVGSADKSTGQKLEPQQLVRMASNTKTYIAAAILRLEEQGKLSVDSSIAKYLALETIAEVARGGYEPKTISVRHLLNHTSGLFDYAMSEPFGRAAFANFQHRWTRMEQLKLAVDSGKPYGTPGEKYHYSDTGYILLGEIIERSSGKPMGQAVRDLLGFDKLVIRYTHFETLDSVPAGSPPRVHQYLDTVDTYALDASHDLYGGGGLVSNAEEMARFYRALVRGEVFEKKTTLDEMLTMTPQSQVDRPGGYGMGIGKNVYGDVTCFGHSGFWGTIALHCPTVDLTVVAATNRSGDSVSTLRHLADDAVRMVVAAPERKR